MAELEPVAGRPRVVAVCLVPARRAVAVRLLGEVAMAGGDAVLVTADGKAAGELPSGVRHLDLAADERRLGMHPVLTRSPARLAAKVTRRPAKPGAAAAWRRYSTSAPYRAARPWVLWRALRRHTEDLPLDQVDHVIIVSIESWPTAWQLMRRSSGATYGWDVPDEVYERCGRRPPVRTS